MSAGKLSRQKSRLSRRRRIRARVRGTAEQPRLSVFRSKKHLVLQLIDDDRSHTLVAVRDTQLPKNIGVEKGQSPGVACAFALGKFLAEKAKKVGIKKIVFDRGGYLYHGRVKAVADGARAGGLQF